MVSKDLFTLLVTIEIFDATSRSQLVQLHEVVDAHEHQHGQGPAVELWLISDEPKRAKIYPTDLS